ncbi:hypothetical protein JG688_00002790 [Phytophthora aleatoria]|uniref:Uncharacterized protein n=1 Tax=Phytophthora aleatoria TaxID=2496075 RepID=A0A8J5IU77_9STRA|nr:hypothetical protein JG688_00002790 [Phytophthora aleatoria]
MTTQETSEATSAPNSPSSKAGTAPSDSAAPASRAGVVDVAGGDEPWTATLDRKGKKKATKRASASSAASTGRKKPEEDEGDASDLKLEDKVDPPQPKKSKKATTSTEAATAVQLPAPTYPETASSSRQGFDLTSFMQSFVPGRATVSASAPTAEPHVEEEAGAVPTAAPSDPAADVMAELRALREEVVRLRLIRRQDGNRWDGVAPGIVTAPNSKGELPPPDVRFLMSASFLEGSKKTKGDYNPPQATLDDSSRGLTVMHFKESSEMTCLEDGSTNVNFSSDISRSTGLPTVGVECRSYDDILDAIHGLSTLGQDVWYDYMRKLTRLLRVFVSKNKSADPETTPVCVRLTLLYVNKIMGAALAHMHDDDPQWWSGFCESLRAIDYQLPAWTMALVSVLTQE